MATKTQSKKTPPIDQSGSPVQATAKTDIKATLEQMMSHPPAQTREEFLGLPAGVELAPRAGKNLLEQDEDITADDIFGTDPVQGPGIDDQPKQLDTQPSTSGDPDAKDISTKKNSAYDKDGAFIPPRIPVTEEDVDRFLSCIARNAYYSEKFVRGEVTATFRVKSSIEVQYLRACISKMVSEGQLLSNDDLNVAIAKFNMFFQLHEFCGKVTPKPVIPPRPWNTDEQLNLETQFWSSDLGNLTDASSLVIQGMMIQFENKVTEIERLILDPKYSRGDAPS